MKPQELVCTAGALLKDLKSCILKRDLEWGKILQQKAFEIGLETNRHVATALIKMYSKCRCMKDAQWLFDNIKQPDLVSWNTLVLGYAENGNGIATLDLFSRMKARGYEPDPVTYVAALKACSYLADKRACLEQVRKIHSEISCRSNHYVRNTLIDMYSKCGSMVDAHRVFDNMDDPDLVSWNALILGYAENEEGDVALELFSTMKFLRHTPDHVTYIAALKSCSSLKNSSSLERLREIHIEIGCHPNLAVMNTLVDVYSKCSCMVEARRVFDSIQKPTLVSWNALLSGYATNGEGYISLSLFYRMKVQGYIPSPVTYIAAFKACTSLAQMGNSIGLQRGREIHSEISFLVTDNMRNALIKMYATCGSMVEAHCVFKSMRKPDVVSWTTLMMGYAENGDALIALDLFDKMKARGCVPNSITFIAALKACACLAFNKEKKNILKQGREIHTEIGSHMNHQVQTTLIDMYSKFNSMVDAHRVFDSVERPNVVSFNVLLHGYADNGEGYVVLDVFYHMKVCGCIPDSLTYVALIKACSMIGALALGRKFHSEIKVVTVHVVTCLVDFYAKCGSMTDARNVFEGNSRARGVPTWNALLAGYSSFGDYDSVYDVFNKMQHEMFRPDGVTFVCLLLGYSHAGLVKRAQNIFEDMPVKFAVTPTLMHYTCMVDVLGRANQLNEALALLRQMPCRSDAVAWTALLSACRKWKNVEVGRLAFRVLVEMEDASAHVVMAQIYGSRGLWEERERLLEMR